MHHDLPPIAKLAERLQLDIEQAVRGFPRFHRYQLGSDLRAKAREIVRLCHRAWRDRPRVRHWTDQLVWAIDEVKLDLQMGSQLRAFRSFAQFEALIRLAEDLGRQAGGWKRQQQHPQGPESVARRGAGARPDTEYPRRPEPAGANR